MVFLDLTDFQKIPKVVPVREECNLQLVCKLVFDKLQQKYFGRHSVCSQIVDIQIICTLSNLKLLRMYVAHVMMLTLAVYWFCGQETAF
jgi:hypothetical protein